MTKLTNVVTPNLRIVSAKILIPHEQADSQRTEELAKRIQEDNLLKNPPIVTPLDNSNDRFVILDGANRVAALKQLGVPHILAQIVPYEAPHVELHTWHHVISGISASQIQAHFEKIPELKTERVRHAKLDTLLDAQNILAHCILLDGQSIILAGSWKDLTQRNQLLSAIIDSYIHDTLLNRSSVSDMDKLRLLYPNVTTVIIFPRYDPAGVLNLVRKHQRIPAGITRHIIHGRALRVNYPLETLQADTPLKIKNQELAAWMQFRFTHRHVRHYTESTYLFDE